MMICDCDDDKLAFIDVTGDGRVAEIGHNGATGDAGDVDAITSREGFLLRFFDMGTEVGAGAGVGVGVGWGKAIAETGAPRATE
jgi:hypothetical protein